MKLSGVYKIESVIKPERVYIGSTVDISIRWKHHLSNLRRNIHHSPKLQNHYNKYGESDLHFSILLSCEKEDLLRMEQYFLSSYQPFFNICEIAGSCLGRKHSDETKKKISVAHTGKKGTRHSDETKKKISEWAKGRKLSDVTKRKLSESKMGNSWNKGRMHTKEARKRMSEAKKLRKIQN